jgi:hypothetical protein
MAEHDNHREDQVEEDQEEYDDSKEKTVLGK